jgi:hypothetical protein
MRKKIQNFCEFSKVYLASENTPNTFLMSMPEFSKQYMKYLASKCQTCQTTT